MKMILSLWLVGFICTNLTSLVISEPDNGNLPGVRLPKSREWLEQVREEAQKQKDHPATFNAAADIVSNDWKARSLFSSSSSSSNESGIKKIFKRQRKMAKRARKNGWYSPYDYRPRRSGMFPGMNHGMNPGMNPGMNHGMNPGMNHGMNPGLYGGNNYGYGGNFGGNYRFPGGRFGGSPPPMTVY